MHADDGDSSRKGVRLAETQTHQQRANEPGGMGDRDGIQCLHRDAGIAERARHHGNDGRQMRTRCDFGHDASEHAMDILRQDDEGAQRHRVAPGLEHRRGRLVTRGLDAEDGGHRSDVSRAG